MSQKSERVKSGYLDLDLYEKEEVRKFIDDFEKKTYEEKKSISKSFSETVRNKSLGPVSSASCPCCGK